MPVKNAKLDPEFEVDNKGLSKLLKHVLIGRLLMGACWIGEEPYVMWNQGGFRVETG